jgi:hypothetical protein
MDSSVRWFLAYLERKNFCIWPIINRGIFGFFKNVYFIQQPFLCRPQIPLCRMMLGSNKGLLRHRHWQSDTLTTGLDLFHTRPDFIHINIINRSTVGHDLAHLAFKANALISIPCLLQPSYCAYFHSAQSEKTLQQSNNDDANPILSLRSSGTEVYVLNESS